MIVLNLRSTTFAASLGRNPHCRGWAWRGVGRGHAAFLPPNKAVNSVLNEEVFSMIEENAKSYLSFVLMFSVTPTKDIYLPILIDVILYVTNSLISGHTSVTSPVLRFSNSQCPICLANPRTRTSSGYGTANSDLKKSQVSVALKTLMSPMVDPRQSR